MNAKVLGSLTSTTRAVEAKGELQEAFMKLCIDFLEEANVRLEDKVDYPSNVHSGLISGLMGLFSLKYGEDETLRLIEAEIKLMTDSPVDKSKVWN